MVYKDGKPIITTVQMQSTNLTWDEYQALPATKLTDGVYYNITDWEQSTLDIVNTLTGENIALQSRIAELENANTCSEEEVRIGTYMGKPLYRRVLYGKLPTATGSLQNIYDIRDFNVDHVINHHGYILQGTYQVPFPNQYMCFHVNYPTNGYIGATVNTWANSDFCMVIEYTKTTDN